MRGSPLLGRSPLVVPPWHLLAMNENFPLTSPSFATASAFWIFIWGGDLLCLFPFVCPVSHSKLPRNLRTVSSPRSHFYEEHVEGPRPAVARLFLDGMLAFDGPLAAPVPGRLFSRNSLGGRGFCGEVGLAPRFDYSLCQWLVCSIPIAPSPFSRLTSCGCGTRPAVASL